MPVYFIVAARTVRGPAARGKTIKPTQPNRGAVPDTGRRDYSARIDEQALAPLWERLADLLPASPQPASLAHAWSYRELRPTLIEAAELIAAGDAERRVLILENPGLRGLSAATESLFAGLQLVMPGEVAPQHRHSPAALRVILESDGGLTTVEGRDIEMCRGDLILTPAWSWHGHANPGAVPLIWLDVLDLPMVRAFGARFAERGEAAGQQAPRTRLWERHGANMASPDRRRNGVNPLIRYPYAHIRETLRQLVGNSRPDPCHGFRMEYGNPLDGGAVLPTISAAIQFLPEDFSGEPYRSTDGTVFCALEGHGRFVVGDGDDARVIEFEPNDVVTIPVWQRYTMCADSPSVLFSTSDRSAQQRLGIWREQRP